MDQMRTRVLTLAVVAGLGGTVTEVAVAQEDPGSAGPHVVRFMDYGSFFENVNLVNDTNNETLAEVYHPDLAGGPYPIVFIVHGRHHTCMSATGAVNSEWPCPTGSQPYWNYRGYRNIADRLASQGIVAVSISANGISSDSTPEDGYQRLIQRHLDIWAGLNANPNSAWRNKLDLSRVGLIGHSRGGQGVMAYAADNPGAVAAVLAIAPTAVAAASPIDSAPLAVLLGYCDGDVEDLGGVGFVDQARYSAATDSNPKYTILALGANHNYFNRYWTPGGITVTGGNWVDPQIDDWTRVDEGLDDPHCGASGERLTAEEQRGVGLAYASAFFRAHLLGQSQFETFLRGDSLPPPSALTDEVYVGYLPGASRLREIRRFATLDAGTTFTGGLTWSICQGVACQTSTARSTHFGNLSALKVAWSTSGQSVSNSVPAAERDVSNYGVLQLRVAVNHTAAPALNPVGLPRDFSIQLTDGAGAAQSVRVSDYSDVLYYPPGDAVHRKNIMHTVRIPLDAFGSLDRRDITSVNFVFDRSTSGALLISDLVFADEGMSPAATWWVASAGFLLL